jgi:hypothetical protein
MLTPQESARPEMMGLDTEYPVSDTQVNNLRELGWTRLPGLLQQATVEFLRTQILSQPPRSPDAVSKSFRKAGEPGGNRGAAYLDRESDPRRNYNHEGMAWRIPGFREIATSRRIASAAVRLMQRERAVFVQDISFIKPANGIATAMHQDYSNWPFDRRGQISVWIALVDMSAEMGPLQYIERSHTFGPLGIAEKLDVRTYPELDRCTVGGGQALAAGDAQVHWDLTVHGSGPNNTATVREAYVLRFARTDAIYNGIGHPHYDLFDLPIGGAFGEFGQFPAVDSNGLVPAGN